MLLPRVTENDSRQLITWLRTSESDADETNVIASPLVPNLPALPTYTECQKKKKKPR